MSTYNSYLLFSYFLIIFSSGDSLNLMLFVCNGLFLLVLIQEETANIWSLCTILKTSRILQSLLHRALGQFMQNMSGISPERSVTVQPQWLHVAEVSHSSSSACSDLFPSTDITGDQLVVPSGDWPADKWSFSLKEMCIKPEVTLQAVLTLSPEEAQAGQWHLRIMIYKRAWSSEKEKSKRIKGCLMSFWFLEETRLGRSHPQCDLISSLVFSVLIIPTPFQELLHPMASFYWIQRRGETS